MMQTNQNKRLNKLKSRSIILLSIVLILFLPNLFSQEKSATEEEKSEREYKIGPKDLLEVSVFGHDDLNIRVRVSEEGKITLPLIGEVDVEGLNKTEVENKISRLLEEGYLQNPQVTIFIVEYQSKRVSVLGAVKNPGRYELLGRETVLEKIAQAGGFTPDAGDDIIITRENNHGTKKSLKISIEDLTLKEDAKVDIPLQPNDTIYIPPDKIVYIYVTGQVRSPGAIEVKQSLLPHFTLLRAIAQAGGFSDRAKKGSVLIKRIGEDGRERVMEVNVKDIEKGKTKDIPLKENDVIIVQETIF
jgi:polysaccharide export outer membrane protein